MVKRAGSQEQNTLTATVERCKWSYSLVDHRPAVDRLDDEGLLEFSATIDEIAEGRQDLVGNILQVTISCAASYYPNEKAYPSPIPTSTLTLRKGACSALIHMPPKVFWGLRSLLVDTQQGELSLGFGRLLYGRTDLTSVDFQQSTSD